LPCSTSCSFLRHPQLKILPSVKSPADTFTLLPQSHLHSHITDPLYLSLSSIELIAINLPNLSPEISLALNKVSLAKHPQLRVGCFLEVMLSALIHFSFPQSHLQ
jgi:hypothetical protein